MEVKDGNELRKAINDINVQEELAEIAKEDPNAKLINDMENSVISSLFTGSNIYKNNMEFLKHRLAINHGSLDKLCEELDYDPYDFLTDSCDIDEGDSFSSIIEWAYGSERIGDVLK